MVIFPAEIAPGYRIFIRGPHNAAVAEVLNVHKGASPWWEEQPTPELNIQPTESNHSEGATDTTTSTSTSPPTENEVQKFR
jgi:hypothetical protein